jgi:hypothetical protein
MLGAIRILTICALVLQTGTPPTAQGPRGIRRHTS